MGTEVTPTGMARVLVMNPLAVLSGMAVCAVADATDEEILDVCNRENPSGTRGGWSSVVRTLDQTINNNEGQVPCPCRDHPERMHFLVFC